MSGNKHKKHSVLQQSLLNVPDKSVVDELCCIDCIFWSGSCRKERVNRIARDPICSDFKPRITEIETCG